MALTHKLQSSVFLRTTAILTIILLIIESIALIWLPFWESLRVVFGTSFVIFLPGFVLSYVFFPQTVSIIQSSDAEEITGVSIQRGHPALDWVERITLSFILSLSVVPLVVYLTNRIGLPITTATVIFLTAGITLAGLVALFWRWKEYPRS